MSKPRKPDIVCIGAQKAGTSWLHETLATREDVWVPPFKELHFFDNKFVEECRKWAPWHVRQGLKKARKEYVKLSASPDPAYLEYLDKLGKPPILNGTWYKFVFSQARKHQTCLDVTPEYSCLPDEGVDFFRKFLPKAQLVYIIRNPLDRLMSQVRMTAHRKKLTSTSRDGWDDLLAMPALQSRGDYRQIVPRWDDRFPEDKLMYIAFGQIHQDPMGVLRKVESHCGLSPRNYLNATRRIHGTKEMALPQFVVDRLKEMTAAQDEFLTSRFGRAFFEKTA